MYFEVHLKVLQLTKHFRSSFLALQSCCHAVFFSRKFNVFSILFSACNVDVDFPSLFVIKRDLFRIFPVLAIKCKCVLIHLIILEYFRPCMLIKLITNTFWKCNIPILCSQNVFYEVRNILFSFY